MQDSIISISDVRKAYGKVQALCGVDLEVPKGTVLGLLGPNGAGKTTLVKILTTLLKPDHGTALVSGIDVVRDPAAVRSQIGLAGQYAAVDENLTGKENLELVGRLYHLSWREVRSRVAKLLKRFSLEDAANRFVKTYSGGMRRRLDLAASLVGEPEILFLDEPTAGLDPRSRAELWEMLDELRREGTTLLLTTQYLEEVDYLADIIAIIDHGALIAKGTSSELKSKIGGGVLELHLADKLEAERGAAMLEGLGSGPAHVDNLSGQITLPVNAGTATLLEAIRKFDAGGLTLADIELRKPTLDEVFLELTKRK